MSIMAYGSVREITSWMMMEKLKTSPENDPPRTGFLKSSGDVHSSSERQTGRQTDRVLGKGDVLGVKDHGKSVVRDLQDEASVHQTVCGLQTTMTQTSEMKVSSSTLMRSISSEDLNIQSSLMSPSASRSARLPRGQCSTTRANSSESRNRPTYRPVNTPPLQASSGLNQQKLAAGGFPLGKLKERLRGLRFPTVPSACVGARECVGTRRSPSLFRTTYPAIRPRPSLPPDNT
ncbi:hypothetical protein EYF80_051687 [Liparis tanakae]|uniref:Uncharacterized protein n=1 Tax=Liparis tanakae TaxID=230148 RepID=A0A4Z2FAD5_9TELE|nr:hypothetical protein EYF80_051687 [Liparis tanakae]